MKLRQSEGSARESRRQFPLKEPLLAVAMAVPLLLGCREGGSPSEAANAPNAPPASVYTPEPEIPHFVPSGPAYKAVPSAPEAAPSSSPTTTPQPMAVPGGYVPQPGTCPAESESVRRLAIAAGHSDLLGIIDRRVAQERTKMKLTEREGLDASCYIVSDLPSMPQMSSLAGRMPKTVVELLRAMNERGVSREDAEGMASYLGRMLDSMQLSKVDTFDECCSHVLGRRWGQIDYSGESLDPARQERHYASKGVPDLLTAEHVRRYFEVESRMPYFRRLFNPQGPLPE